jgi:putative oxidoreductase
MDSHQSSNKWGKRLLIIGRIALGIVFVVAAYMKMKPQPAMAWSWASIETSLSMFAMGVDSYQILPPWAVSLVAHWLPPFELFLGLWLLAGLGLRASSLIAALLICGFFVAMTSAYRRGLTISCGCFGPGEQIGPKRLIEEGVMLLPLALAVCIGAFLMARKEQEGDQSPLEATAGLGDTARR